MSSKLSHVVQEVADEALHLAQSCSEGGSLGPRSSKDLHVCLTLSKGLWMGTLHNQEDVERCPLWSHFEKDQPVLLDRRGSIADWNTTKPLLSSIALDCDPWSPLVAAAGQGAFKASYHH